VACRLGWHDYRARDRCSYSSTVNAMDPRPRLVRRARQSHHRSDDSDRRSEATVSLGPPFTLSPGPGTSF
jgi:hypothetical protein